MKKILTALSTVASLMVLFTVSASAAPVDKTEAFVCPVFNETVGDNNPNTFGIADGDYSLIPSGDPKYINVPTHATNADGAGSPGGDHSGPGDSDYTAIWAN